MIWEEIFDFLDQNRFIGLAPGFYNLAKNISQWERVDFNIIIKWIFLQLKQPSMTRNRKNDVTELHTYPTYISHHSVSQFVFHGYLHVCHQKFSNIKNCVKINHPLHILLFSYLDVQLNLFSLLSVCELKNVNSHCFTHKYNAFKLRCDNHFQRAFTACSCVFKVITLVWASQRNYFENVNAFQTQKVIQKMVRVGKYPPSYFFLLQ